MHTVSNLHPPHHVRAQADHIRTLTFAIADGARPGNEGREYVLRRVLRRGVRYGREVLGAPEGFFSTLVDAVVAVMGDAYPDLRAKRDAVVEVIREEEASFSRTLVKGIERFKKMAAASKGGTLAGADAFILWDTFGFPVDLTQLMAEEAGLSVDMPGFEAALAGAKELSRAGQKKGAGAALRFEAEATAWLAANGVPRTDDAEKYAEASAATARVAAILSQSGFVNSTAAAGGGPLGVVLDRTPFYAESGGQVADAGALAAPGGALLPVADVQVAAGFVLHLLEAAALEDGGAAGALAVGDTVGPRVDYARRRRVAPNHTFTHVLNHSLRRVLGDHVDQKGSVVAADRLRFDFSNAGPVAPEALAEVEALCRAFISAPRAVSSKEVPLAAAQAIRGVRAMFGEAYPDPVRVVAVGADVDALLAAPDAAANDDVPIEFCGGTHLADTGAAGAFAIMSEEGVAKGVRRIVAVTGADAAAAEAAADALDARAAAAAARPPAEVAELLTELKIAVDEAAIPAARKAALRARVAELIRAAMDAAKKAAAATAARAVEAATAAADAAAAEGKTFLIARVPDAGLDVKALQSAWNAIQKKHPALAVMFLSAADGKALACAGVPAEAAKALPAGEWVAAALGPLGGRGGGKPTFAQGTGPNAGALGEAEAAAEALAALKLT